MESINHYLLVIAMQAGIGLTHIRPMIVSTYHRNQPQMLIPWDCSTPNSLYILGTAVYILYSKSHWTECRCVERYKTVGNVDSVITLDISMVVITYQLLQAGMYIGLLNRHR